jgi:arsenite methyltransferase
LQVNVEKVIDSIKERFVRVALNPEKEKKFPVGPDSAKRLGYSEEEIDSLPLSVTESFAGVGNPFSVGMLQEGEIVLDLGCGAGMDSILAARRIGPNGKVIGIDMTEEMVLKAKKNVDTVGLDNVDIRCGMVETLPVQENSVDVLISNGVLNLCVDKPAVVAEIVRVLRSGGRVQMADILLEEELSPDELAKKGTWSD